MAFREAALVHISTSTTGTGTYTYTDTSPGVGYRNIAQAVADNSLANGDTVFYEVRDTTAAGTANLFERGYGVINTGALTLTRVSITESSNAGAAVNWGAGTRDLMLMNAPMAFFALLSGALFTGAVEVSGSLMSRFDSVRYLQAFAQSAFSTLYARSDKTNKTTFFIGNLWTGVGTAAGESRMQFLVGSESAPVSGPQVRETGELQNAAGVPYEALPAGTALWFKNTTAPPGWTKSTADNDAALRVVSGTPGASGGTLGLSSSATGSTSLSISQMPNHDHPVPYTLALKGAMGVDNVVNAIGSGAGSGNTSATGGGSGHTHPLALKYVDGLVATKN